MYKFYLIIIISFFSFAACSTQSGDLVTVRILSEDGRELGVFKAELADDAQERSMGLMFRNELGPNEGMFFIFREDTTSPFWMKNTLISLDIAYIGSDKKIVSIVQKAPPQTETLRHPDGPYRYVLEVIGGRTEALGIRAGDTVEFQLP